MKPRDFNPELQGASADGEGSDRARIKDKLTSDAVSNSWQAYYTRGGNLQLLCILPAGTPNGGNCSGGTGAEVPFGFPVGGTNHTSNVATAISSDGNRVYWTDWKPGIQELARFTSSIQLETESAVSSGKCTEAAKACTLDVSKTKTPPGLPLSDG